MESRTAWRSIDEFLALDANGYGDGLHSIPGGELTLDMLFVNASKLSDGSQKVLPVFFSGAVTARQGKPGPFFSGSGVAKTLDVAVLCLADPSLAMDPQLGLAWYAGNGRQSTQALITRVLAGIAARLDVELLLIGGSGGGFAALQFAGRLGGIASALVWNPQTDFLKYYRSSVQPYLEACFPGGTGVSSTKAGQVAKLAREGVRHEVITAYAADEMPKRLLYVQNASDTFHVERHAVPFIEGLGMRAIDQHRYATLDGNGMLWFGDWGIGHDAMPKNLLIPLVSRLLDPSIGVVECAEWLQENAPRGNAKVPLSFAGTGTRASLQVRANLSETGLEVHCTWEDKEECIPPQYAFYVFSGEERVQTRWYEASSTARFPVIPDKPPTRVVGFAKDSFGDKIYAMTNAASKDLANNG